MNSVASFLFLVVVVFVEKSACKYTRSHRSHREIHRDTITHDKHFRGHLAESEHHRHANHEFGHRQGHFQKRRLDDLLSYPNIIDTDATIAEKYGSEAVGKNKGGKKTIDADLKSFEGAAAFAERVVKKQESTPQAEGEAAKGRDRPQYDASGNRLTLCAFDYAVLHALDKAAQRVLDAAALSLDTPIKDAFDEIRKAAANLEFPKLSQLTSIAECAYTAENMNKCFKIANAENFTECLLVHDKFKKCLKTFQTERPSMERKELSVTRSMSSTVKNASSKPTESPETLFARISGTTTRNAINPLNESAESTTSVAPSTSTTTELVNNPSSRSTEMPENSDARNTSTTTDASSSAYFSEAENKFQEHLKSVGNYEYWQPKPELVPVARVHENISRNILPNCTVLHRCRCDGCCHDDMDEYVSASEMTVGLYFQIMGKNERIEWPTYQLLQFTNHTSCKCQRKLLTNEIVQDVKPKNKAARTIGAAVSANSNAYSSGKDDEVEPPSSPR